MMLAGWRQVTYSTVRGSRLVALLCCAALLLTGCASRTTTTPGQNDAQGNASPGAPKVLRIAMQAQAEPVEGLVAIPSSTSFGGSAQFEHELMFHGELTTLNPQSTLEARLAAQVPSLNDGSW